MLDAFGRHRDGFAGDPLETTLLALGPAVELVTGHALHRVLLL
jgi:hypothetical protein